MAKTPETMRSQIVNLRSLLLSAADYLGDSIANLTPQERYAALADALHAIENTIPADAARIDKHNGEEINWRRKTFTPAE